MLRGSSPDVGVTGAKGKAVCEARSLGLPSRRRLGFGPSAAARPLGKALLHERRRVLSLLGEAAGLPGVVGHAADAAVGLDDVADVLAALRALALELRAASVVVVALADV